MKHVKRICEWLSRKNLRAVSLALLQMENITPMSFGSRERTVGYEMESSRHRRVLGVRITHNFKFRSCEDTSESAREYGVVVVEAESG